MIFRWPEWKYDVMDTLYFRIVAPLPTHALCTDSNGDYASLLQHKAGGERSNQANSDDETNRPRQIR